ncbi:MULTISPECIES: hypothetical protein [Comamonas]|nr:MULTISPECIES: hypothetical protein [Comamonas]MPT10887.1 hypothetical protein [Comamonas sp.]
MSAKFAGIAMSLLQRLRGDLFQQVPCLGQTLFLYKQGFVLGIFVALITLIIFNLPWQILSFEREAIQLVIAVIGSYASANLVGTRAPSGCPPEVAAKRWI